jgi:hypothetical protein
MATLVIPLSDAPSKMSAEELRVMMTLALLEALIDIRTF